jgi:hypothetical protein
MNDHYLLFSLARSFSFSPCGKKWSEERRKKKREGDMSKDKSKNVQNSSNSILKLYI